jgi:hypothetical protein
LTKVKSRVYALFALLIENLKIRKQNVLLMIGIGVSVLATIVILVFNYILISVKVLAEKVICKPAPVAIHAEPGMKVEDWFKTRGISKQTLDDLRVTEGLNGCHRPKRGKCNKV